MSEMPPGRPARRARAFKSTARATLLWAVASLIVLQGAFRLLIDRVWPELRDPAFEIKARRLDHVLAQHSEGPITVLMTGSSVTSNLFKAKHLEDQLAVELDRDVVVFNMGCHGGGALTQLMWLRRLLERGVRPDFVCVEFSPQLYDSPDTPSDASRFPVHVRRGQDWATIRPYLADEGDMRREWRWYRWCPAYFHRLTILNCLATPLVPVKDHIPTWGGTIDERCWTELPPRSAEDLANTVRQVKNAYETPLKNFTPGKSSVVALEQLLTLLHQEHIPAAVIMAPQSPTLRQLYPKNVLDGFVRHVADLSETRHMPFINAFDWLDEEHFADCIHPTSVGAEIFSTRLKREVLLPALSHRNKLLAGPR